MTPYTIAQRYIGIGEIPGERDHPFIQWCFTLCGLDGETADEVPWCSAFLQHPFWELRLDRSKSARARSWLLHGKPIPLVEASSGFDVVILKRGVGEQPGPDVIAAPGHVGLFAGRPSLDRVELLGGNQGNRVCIASFAASLVLGVRSFR